MLVFMQHFSRSRIIVIRCGPIDLVALYRRQLKWPQTGRTRLRLPCEDLMTFKIPAAKNLAVLLAAAAVVAIGLAATQANAEVKRRYDDQRKYDDRGRPYYGPNGPNVVYQQGPTRIYVTKRSWLDAGTEVLPGERKFMDYAYPPGVSFGRENLNRPIDRQPLNPPSDFGFGDNYSGRFPLY
jgi:hypothetical protein